MASKWPRRSNLTPSLVFSRPICPTHQISGLYFGNKGIYQLVCERLRQKKTETDNYYTCGTASLPQVKIKLWPNAERSSYRCYIYINNFIHISVRSRDGCTYNSSHLSCRHLTMYKAPRALVIDTSNS